MRLARDGPLIAALSLAAALAATGCSDPEPTSFPLTISSLDETEVCGVGTETEELCFTPEALVDVPEDGAHLDDCITVEVTEPGGSEVARATWRGRCTTTEVALGVTLVDGSPVILIPECLGSLTSLRIDDGSDESVYRVARDGSTQHPLIHQVKLSDAAPLVVHEPWTEPAPDTELTASANQQSGLPPGTVTFTIDELDDEVVTTDGRYASAEEYQAAAGCRTNG